MDSLKARLTKLRTLIAQEIEYVASDASVIALEDLFPEPPGAPEDIDGLITAEDVAKGTAASLRSLAETIDAELNQLVEGLPRGSGNEIKAVDGPVLSDTEALDCNTRAAFAARPGWKFFEIVDHLIDTSLHTPTAEDCRLVRESLKRCGFQCTDYMIP